jgi:poly(3-hydroxybutyrate) depolymerase
MGSFGRKLRAPAFTALAIFGAAALVAGLPNVAPRAEAAPASPSGSTAAKPDVPTSTPPQTLHNPGYPDAYFYKPRSSRGMKPVIVYLHGRGGIPDEGCRAWAKVATEFGWLLCPAGQEDRGGGQRGWNNSYIPSLPNVTGAVKALREKFGRRVQLRGNVLIGFSEGAYVAQNVGIRESQMFNRWLIVASTDHYFGFDETLLKEAKKNVKRVYLWTGELDGVANESQRAFEHLRADGYNVKLNIAKGFWHAIPTETMGQNYRRALRWLVSAK